MKIKRLFLILPLLILLFLLSGCIEFNINIGIEADFTSYLTYDINIDLSEKDLRYKDELLYALNRLGWLYQEEHGFAVQIWTDEVPYRLMMTKRVANDSFDEAYQSLEDMLTDERITPFMMVDMALLRFDRQEKYIFSAMADIPQILRLSNVVELSPQLKEELDFALETGKGAITLTMPTSEIIDSNSPVTGINYQSTISVPLSFSEQTLLELTARVNFMEDGRIGGSVSELISVTQNLQTIAKTAIWVAIFFLSLAVLLMIINAVKRKRRRKQRF
ncbi:MAG: hypothetical protein LBC73_07980 [Oscillospiraceae bacterium]|jgi:hypothetical protein|nr:hypothetical protein [Oscillospiraceae bacterium]